MHAAPAGEQPVTRQARCLFDAALRLFAGPDEHFVANPPCGKPSLKPPDFIAAFWPEPMIHRQRANLPTVIAHPSMGENGEREAVGAAGYGDGEKRRRFEPRERGERGPELAEAQWFCLRSFAQAPTPEQAIVIKDSSAWPQQPSRLFSSVALSLIAPCRRGKSRSIWVNATQAFCF